MGEGGRGAMDRRRQRGRGTGNRESPVHTADTDGDVVRKEEEDMMKARRRRTGSAHVRCLFGSPTIPRLSDSHRCLAQHTIFALTECHTTRAIAREARGMLAYCLSISSAMIALTYSYIRYVEREGHSLIKDQTHPK